MEPPLVADFFHALVAVLIALHCTPTTFEKLVSLIAWVSHHACFGKTITPFSTNPVLRKAKVTATNVMTVGVGWTSGMIRVMYFEIDVQRSLGGSTVLMAASLKSVVIILWNGWDFKAWAVGRVVCWWVDRTNSVNWERTVSAGQFGFGLGFLRCRLFLPVPRHVMVLTKRSTPRVVSLLAYATYSCSLSMPLIGQTYAPRVIWVDMLHFFPHR